MGAAGRSFTCADRGAILILRSQKERRLFHYFCMHDSFIHRRSAIGIYLLAATLFSACSDGAEHGSDFSDSSGPASGFVRTAELAKGRRLFKQNGCYVCHGDGGRGDGKIAHTLDPRPRDLADRAAYKRGAGLKNIMGTIEKGIGERKVIMPGYRHLSVADRRSIARYIQSLQKRGETAGVDSTG